MPNGQAAELADEMAERLAKIDADYEAKAKAVTSAHTARTKKIEEAHETQIKKINRAFRRDMIIIGFVAALVLALIVWALIHDHGKSAECKTRTCPERETPVILDDKCICVTEAMP
jgi:hypothetical protein